MAHYIQNFCKHKKNPIVPREFKHMHMLCSIISAFFSCLGLFSAPLPITSHKTIHTFNAHKNHFHGLTYAHLLNPEKQKTKAIIFKKPQESERNRREKVHIATSEMHQNREKFSY